SRHDVGKYVTPEEVVSPKRHWSLIAVLDDDDRSTLAIGRWDGEAVLAMRWNGNKDNPIGNPQSRGLATWFILPEKYWEGVLSTLQRINLRSRGTFFLPVMNSWRGQPDETVS